MTGPTDTQTPPAAPATPQPAGGAEPPTPVAEEAEADSSTSVHDISSGGSGEHAAGLVEPKTEVVLSFEQPTSGAVLDAAPTLPTTVLDDDVARDGATAATVVGFGHQDVSPTVEAAPPSIESTIVESAPADRADPVSLAPASAEADPTATALGMDVDAARPFEAVESRASAVEVASGPADVSADVADGGSASANRVDHVRPAPVPAGAGPAGRDAGVQFALFGKHPSHDDFYWFADTGSDDGLAWFESAVARQMRDRHPGDAPGRHDRWVLWLTRQQTAVAAAWDSRDSHGRQRTPLFVCVAGDAGGTAFVRQATAWLSDLHRRLFDGPTPTRAEFLDVVRSAREDWPRADGAAADAAVAASAGALFGASANGHSRPADDVLRAVGIADLSAAAALFPQAGLSAKLWRAGRLLRNLSGKKVADDRVAPAVRGDGHCRVWQQGVSAAASLEGWAALAELTQQTGPLGVFVSESGVVDLYAAKPEAVDLSALYDEALPGA